MRKCDVMNNTLYKPDYENCILGIPNSILAHYGAKPRHATLPVLDDILRKSYNNIVLIAFDGMGMDALKAHAPDGFLMKHCAAQLDSVYPCTTTSALTTFETGLTPVEHGWLGWSMYFKEIGKCVDLFSGRQSGTDRPAAAGNYAWETIGYKNLFAQIAEADASIDCCRVSPFGGGYWADTDESMCKHIEALCKKDGRRYIWAYHFQPDTDMHENGCYSECVREDIVSIDKRIERLAAGLTDTLLIVTADHGLTDIADLVVEDFPEIGECLAVPLNREPRSLSFFIKPECIDAFPAIWAKRFGNDFLFLTGDEAIECGIFGKGVPHSRVKDFLGDYVALATGNLALWYRNEKGEASNHKACHSGLRREEMIVPLIIIECR